MFVNDQMVGVAGREGALDGSGIRAVWSSVGSVVNVNGSSRGVLPNGQA